MQGFLYGIHIPLTSSLEHEVHAHISIGGLIARTSWSLVLVSHVGGPFDLAHTSLNLCITHTTRKP